MRLFPLLLFTVPVCAGTLTPVWVELGPDGAVLARVVVETKQDCPELRADGRALAMHVREPLPEGFKPACEASIPAGTRSLRWGRKRLPLPKTPERAIVIGDTGCRINHGMLQACNDPSLWPFAAIARQIARRKPDLVVHVGDYLYRENACPDPVASCAGPHGDNWETWNADFFQPAEAALTAAPWVFARGNHEDCKRAFKGWFYYLDPRPFDGTCRMHTDSYIAESGKLRIGVLDSASTVEPLSRMPEQSGTYAKQLAALSGRAEWIADHHPFWAYASGKDGFAAEPQTLAPAWFAAHPAGIRLILSGHVHLFEFLDLPAEHVRQVIAGDGGTQLLTGVPVKGGGAGALVKAGEVNLSFGFTELERTGSGWKLTLRNAEGASEIGCKLPDGGDSTCQTTQQKQPSSARER